MYKFSFYLLKVFKVFSSPGHTSGFKKNFLFPGGLHAAASQDFVQATFCDGPTPSHFETRVARFILVQHAKTDTNIPNEHKLSRNGHKIYQMDGKFTKFTSHIGIPVSSVARPSQDLPKLEF
jgi:hypothetical protein